MIGRRPTIILNRALKKNDGFAFIDKDAMFDMIAHGPGQHAAFDLASGNDQLIGRHVVGHPFGFLFDDRTFVKLGSDIMGGRPNDLDPARMG